MRRTILAALAAPLVFLGGLAASANAEAPEKWVYAGMQGGAMGWEASSITRDEAAGTASALRFFYFARPEAGEDGDFSWAFQNVEFDCDDDTFRLMNGAFFNKARRDRSDQAGSDAIVPVQANTPEYVLMRVLCDNATLSGTMAAANMADAMDGVEALVRRQAAAADDRSRG